MSTPSFARRCSRSVVLTAAALVVAASGVGFSQDNKQDADQDQESNHRLPNFYARVVSGDQRDEIYGIQDKHAPAIEELQKQLDAATAARDKEIEAVLTPEQLARVQELEKAAEARREARRGPGRRGRAGGGGDAGGSGGGGQ